MNWNMDVKELSGRQILLLIAGIAALCGLLYRFYNNTLAIGVGALVVFVFAGWRLSNRAYDNQEATTSVDRRPRQRK